MIYRNPFFFFLDEILTLMEIWGEWILLQISFKDVSRIFEMLSY